MNNEQRKIEKAVKDLDAIIVPGDRETAHYDADQILLRMVPLEVREAYERLENQGFWYA